MAARPKDEIQQILPVLLKDEDPQSKLNLNSEVTELIEKNLKRWIKEKGYTKKNLTIQIVASEVFTNRTYLSSYINTIYNCSFKVWVTQLRIDESQQLLASAHNYSMSQIADTCGFSSSTSFIHVFTKYQKVPPNKWREGSRRNHA